MEKMTLTAENYADIIAKYTEIRAAHRSEAEMWTVHGYHHDATNAAIARWYAENEGQVLDPIPKETVTLTKSEFVEIAEKAGYAAKESDDCAAILAAVKAVEVKPINEKVIMEK